MHEMKEKLIKAGTDILNASRQNCMSRCVF